MAGMYDVDRRLTFQEIRTANVERVSGFGHGNLDDGWNVAEWGNALAGETGELCNILKKMIRQAPGDPPIEKLTEMAAEEAADVLIYLDLLCAKMDVSLADAVINKFNAVSTRHQLPVKLCGFPGCTNRNQSKPCPLCYE